MSDFESLGRFRPSSRILDFEGLGGISRSDGLSFTNTNSYEISHGSLSFLLRVLRFKMLVGEDLEFLMQEAWEFLMDEQAGPVCIYGAGGIGKTTLMRKLHSKLVTEQNFEYVVWVTVSSNSRVEKIHDAISKSIGLFDAKWVYSSFVERSELVGNKLHGKKFALFLDDARKQVDLSELGVPSLVWCRQNKLVFTTRSRTVAYGMFAQLTLQMDVLSTEDAWRLFRYKVGNDILSDPIISKVSEILVTKCQGLPIFLCTVGRAMASRNTRNEWSDALVEIQRLEPSHQKIRCCSSVLRVCLAS